MASAPARTQSAVDISVVMIGHDQNHLIYSSIVSVERATARARARGFSVELLLMLRDATPALLQWVSDRVRAPWRVLQSQTPGHGAARNEAIAASSGTYLAWIDGWELWSENWLEAAMQAAEAAPAPAVWHPEAIVRFGDSYFSSQGYALVWQPDGAAGGFDYAALLDGNPYATGPFAARSVFDDVPFPIEDRSRGWEDVTWWWTCNVAGGGHHHAVVRETFHYQRADVQNRPRSRQPGVERSRIGPTPLARLAKNA
jgi:hypothetical protein